MIAVSCGAHPGDQWRVVADRPWTDTTLDRVGARI